MISLISFWRSWQKTFFFKVVKCRRAHISGIKILLTLELYNVLYWGYYFLLFESWKMFSYSLMTNRPGYNWVLIKPLIYCSLQYITNEHQSHLWDLSVSAIYLKFKTRTGFGLKPFFFCTGIGLLWNICVASSRRWLFWEK